MGTGRAGISAHPYVRGIFAVRRARIRIWHCHRSSEFYSWQEDACALDPNHLTNRWRQPLAAVLSRFDFMREFPMFATLVPASGASALSR